MIFSCYVVASCLICGCYVDVTVLCGCYALFFGCYVVASWLLCGSYVDAMKLVFGCNFLLFCHM